MRKNSNRVMSPIRVTRPFRVKQTRPFAGFRITHQSLTDIRINPLQKIKHNTTSLWTATKYNTIRKQQRCRTKRNKNRQQQQNQKKPPRSPTVAAKPQPWNMQISADLNRNQKSKARQGEDHHPEAAMIHHQEHRKPLPGKSLKAWQNSGAAANHLTTKPRPSSETHKTVKHTHKQKTRENSKPKQIWSWAKTGETPVGKRHSGVAESESRRTTACRLYIGTKALDVEC